MFQRIKQESPEREVLTDFSCWPGNGIQSSSYLIYLSEEEIKMLSERYKLSRREYEVIAFRYEGFTYQRIADILNISKPSVKIYENRAKAKFLSNKLPIYEGTCRNERSESKAIQEGPHEKR